MTNNFSVNRSGVKSKLKVCAATLVSALCLAATNSASAASDWKFTYVDTFDNASVLADYGLNDKLAERQLYLPGSSARWVRKAGAWYHKPVIREWWSQVNHPVAPNQLTLHTELSAVMLDKPLQAGVNGDYSISVKTDPVLGNTTDGEWTSIMLDGSQHNQGYVSQTNFGFLIRSSGEMSVFQNGKTKPLSIGAVPAAATYDLVLNIKNGSLQGTVNGLPISAVLDEPVPSTAYLYLGAYIDANTGKVSSFDDLSVRVSANNQKRLKQYGYYWADSNIFGANIPSVASYTNYNFVDFVDRVDASKCQNKSCIVQIRWEFWGTTNLLPDWKERWKVLFAKIKAKQQFIAAVYHIDEPLWVGVSPGDFQTVLAQVKKDLATIPEANIKQMATFARPEVSPYEAPDLGYFADLDVVAFDHYVASSNFGEIETMLAELKRVYPNKPVMLVPQTYFEGTKNDAETAEINWKFYDLALKDPAVVGLFNFGLWSFSKPETVPLTLKVQKLIGKSMLNPN